VNRKMLNYSQIRLIAEVDFCFGSFEPTFSPSANNTRDIII